MNEIESTSSTGPRFFFKEIMNIASVKIQKILQARGCMSVQRLVKLVHEKDEVVYQALGRLADEGKITSVLQGRTEYIFLTGPEPMAFPDNTKEER